MRIGIGYDVHRLVIDRPLIIGGVDIDHEMGLLGHSDADVLIHAAMDAIIGAMGLGDIGKHFPDTEVRYQGISSSELLQEVKKLMDEHGYRIGNLDATIIAQMPKMAPHINEMASNIAKVLDCDASQINIKATTEEQLGFTGRGEGISANAVVLLAN
jgi:2-C-methyl-D-erythritol 2,4-cyclodiphosphate synthase